MSYNFPWKKSDFWRGKKVLVAGLGILGGGVGVARFFAENGAKVTVTDLKKPGELRPSLTKLRDLPIKFTLGKHQSGDFQSQDLIIRNPAVPLDSFYLNIARKKGIPIIMESTIFFKLSCSKNIIGVTGTKGKTTTTLLIGEILKNAKKDVVISGNFRVSALSLLPKIKKDTWIVLELSSWQLEGLKDAKISPHIAILTNIMQDHLNRYKNMDDYISAKKNIFKFQKKDDIFITNKDNRICRRLAEEAKSQVLYFSQRALPEKIKREIKLPGKHNLSNVACAYTLARVLGIDDSCFLAALAKFRGVSDRLELVRKISGISFVNDTCATTPEATIAAINSFSSPLTLICGGADKNLNFSELGRIINQRVKSVVLLEGGATDKIEKEVQKKKILGRFKNFHLAVLKAYKNAKKEDLILLSPACASFGMFKNEFDRGEQFRKIVNRLTS
jgi:UDP-N-acetylmuramoylalanine--D-glutamate ligase